jgi:hypothetical protein
MSALLNLVTHNKLASKTLPAAFFGKSAHLGKKILLLFFRYNYIDRGIKNILLMIIMVLEDLYKFAL